MTNMRSFGRINNCHMNKEVLKMFNDERGAYDACCEVPSNIFQVMKLGYYEVVEELIENNRVNINICDSVGNNVIMKLFKLGEYEIVARLLKKKNLDINHQNDEGDTFGHILVLDNSPFTVKLLTELVKKSNFSPNIKNNKGETILDRALRNNYMCTIFKILEDKRFTDIDISLFKKLYLAVIKNKNYGKYARLNNLEIIVNNLAKKELIPGLRELIEKIKNNMELIRQEIMSNRLSLLDNIVNSFVLEAAI